MRRAAVLCSFLLLAAASATAQDRPEELPFKPHFRGVQLVEWIGTPIAVTVAATAFLLPTRDDRGAWHTDVDDGVRSALRLSTQSLRDAASATSDGLVLAGFTWEVVDALAIAGLAHHSAETAATLIFIDIEAHALVASIQEVTVAVASRERPWGTACGTPDGPSAAMCANDASRYRSSFSGHTAHAFTAAALTCMHHANLPLLGGNAEMMPCLATLGVAALTGLLRIQADAHYLSDVLTGAAIGSLVGSLLPWLLHYSQAEPVPGVHVALVPNGLGAGVVGTF